MALLTCLLLDSGRSHLYAQGSLTPPGAPAPTMKTLDQVEARTPLAGGTTTVTISADGSYYLTGPITVASGNGITITANNVTLDLNGFAVTGTATSSPGDGVLYNGSGNFLLRNGHIQGTTAFNGTFSGAGIYDGVNVGANAHTVRIENVDVYGVSASGIYVNAAVAVISFCQTYVTGSDGIYAPATSSTIDHCIQQTCGADGITGGAVNDSFGTSLAGNGIKAASITNCTGTTNTGIAIYATGTATNCTGTANTTGRGVVASVALNCRGSTGGGYGIGAAYAATGCVGTATGTGTGINASTATNCGGYNTGTGAGINAGAANGCYGSSNNGSGIVAASATNCVAYTLGTSTSAIALDCGPTGVAIGCQATAIGGTATTLRAYIANSCVLGAGATTISYKYNMP